MVPPSASSAQKNPPAANASDASESKLTRRYFAIFLIMPLMRRRELRLLSAQDRGGRVRVDDVDIDPRGKFESGLESISVGSLRYANDDGDNLCGQAACRERRNSGRGRSHISSCAGAPTGARARCHAPRRAASRGTMPNVFLAIRSPQTAASTRTARWRSRVRSPRRRVTFFFRSTFMISHRTHRPNFLK